MKLANTRALVVGLGETGLAMARWLARQGARVRVVDSRVQPPNVEALRSSVPNAELVAGPFASASFADVDLIALSPGVPVQTPEVEAAAARGVPVVSEIELFAAGVREFTPAARILAITGSNGKTTTTALTAHLLNSAGVPAIACGNISPAALEALMGVLDGAEPYAAQIAPHKAPEVWVLELSSFQLETTHSLNADAATVLNLSEDHLDRYQGMDEYAAAKMRIFQGKGCMVLNRDDERSLYAGRCGRKMLTFGLDAAPRSSDYGLVEGCLVRGKEKLLALSELRLAGMHNAANAMAALALCEAIGVAPQKLLHGLRNFTGLAHRVEFVAEQGGVAFFDDSKGTNVGATLAAIQGMGRRVAIILGGDGKGQDFTPLAPALAAHGRAVALIGRDAMPIAEAIAGCGLPMQQCAGMEEAVRWCAGQAEAGDAVLLSPACASLDMYRNYAHRAEVFVAAVQALIGETA